MRKLIFVIGAVMTLAFATTAYAETDEFGNEIDWVEDAGGDDVAVSETDEADLMEAPTYGADEQQAVLDQIPETEAETRTGILEVKADLGDDWAGYNVTLVVYDENNRREEVTCYAQNDYEARATVPVGSYRVYRAYVPGDETGDRYPLLTSETKVTVSETLPGSVTILRVVDSENGKQTAPAVEETEAVKETAEKGTNIALLVVAGIGAVLAVLLIVLIVLFVKWMNEHRKYQ
jgi:hypothetical protein